MRIIITSDHHNPSRDINFAIRFYDGSSVIKPRVVWGRRVGGGVSGPKKKKPPKRNYTYRYIMYYICPGRTDSGRIFGAGGVWAIGTNLS